MSKKLNLSISFNAFREMQQQERQSLYDAHGVEHREAVDSVLREHAWAVFVGDSNEAVASGSTLDSYPADEELVALGEKHDQPVFPYSNYYPPEELAA